MLRSNSFSSTAAPASKPTLPRSDSVSSISSTASISSSPRVSRPIKPAYLMGANLFAYASKSNNTVPKFYRHSKYCGGIRSSKSMENLTLAPTEYRSEK